MYNSIVLENYHKNLPIFFYLYDDCFISNHLRNKIIWEKHLHNIFEKYINKDSIVLEAGCHIGTHSIKLALLAKKVILFEPLPSSFDLLKKNLKINGLNNFNLYQKGISNTNNQVFFDWVPKDNPGGSGLSNNPMGRPQWIEKFDKHIKVKLTSIDDLNLKKLDFIKLDIEGYEELAIKGAIKTIKKFKPIIVMEVYSDQNGNHSLEYAINKFRDLIELGYTCIHIKGPDFLYIPL